MRNQGGKPMAVQEGIKITSVQEYREMLAQPHTVTLPSGAVFKIRRLSALDYIENGVEQLPNEFLQFIAELKSPTAPKEFSDKASEEYLKIFEKYLEATLFLGTIEPKVVLIYDKGKKEGQLCFSELNSDDATALIRAITCKIGEISEESLRE
jgi:hypothetical protein